MDSSGRLAARWPGDPTHERFLWKLSLSFDTRHTFVLKLFLLLLKRAIPSNLSTLSLSGRSRKAHMGTEKHRNNVESSAPLAHHRFAFLIRTATASSLLYTCHLFKHRKLPNYAKLCARNVPSYTHTYYWTRKLARSLSASGSQGTPKTTAEVVDKL